MAQAQVVAWPEPKPLWSNGSQHIGYPQKAFVNARMINRLSFWRETSQSPGTLIVDRPTANDQQTTNN